MATLAAYSQSNDEKEKARIIAKLGGLGLQAKEGEGALDQMPLDDLKKLEEQFSQMFGAGGGLGNLFGGMGMKPTPETPNGKDKSSTGDAQEEPDETMDHDEI